jgi:hypothetical protein
VALVLFIACVGCASAPQIHEEEAREVPPRILIEAGKKLGVDFSSPLFANQTKCYDDPFAYYGLGGVSFHAICYTERGLITTAFWAKKYIPVEEFVRKNLNSIVESRKNQGLNSTGIHIEFLEEKNGVAYHHIAIDDDYFGVQGTLLIKTKEADALGLQTIIIVKGKNPEAVRNRMDMIKKVVGVTS